MTKRTALYKMHCELGAQIVDFAGWEMPLHYGSQIDEHHYVRNDAGLFDVSHMGVIDIEGSGAKNFLEYLLANNVDKLKEPGRALYSCLLNNEGGVVDDLIVYYIAPTCYRLVVNAATTEKDLKWMQSVLSLVNDSMTTVTITHRTHFALVAVQGPKARERAAYALSQYEAQIRNLKSFQFFMGSKTEAQKSEGNLGNLGNEVNKCRDEWLIARTGYTGEDGLEIILPSTDVEELWQRLLKAGIHPVGLGARDTLRLEAGLNLYGQDMDEQVSPLESNLAWTVAFEPESRDFVGRSALTAQKERGVSKKLVGLVLLDKGVLRHDQPLLKNHGSDVIGSVTSGSFSPTLKKSIGLARVQVLVENECKVEIRGKLHRAQIVQPPFVRRTH